MRVTQPVKRCVKPFRSHRELRKYYILLALFIILSVLAAIGLILYKNPVPVDSPSFKPVLKRRMVAVVAMAIVAFCQSFSTISFQTATNNRLITPSLMGFEALYSTIHTTIIFFLGSKALDNFKGPWAFCIQIFLMMLLSLGLYSWLLNDKRKNVDLLLLVGVILGGGLRSISAFMRRLLTPSEFDVLQARLFGSVNNADSSYFPIAIPIVVVAIIILMANSKKMNILALGRDCATNLGVNYAKYTKIILALSSILISISTALVGPITFLGFLVATIIYELIKTYDHKFIMPIAACLSFLVLAGSYFLMYHVFNAQGVVSIIIELFGGIAFLILLFRKGNL